MDNIILVSASMLPFKQQWQKIIQTSPRNEAMLIVPEGETQLRQVMRRVVPTLRANGRQVRAISAAQFR